MNVGRSGRDDGATFKLQKVLAQAGLGSRREMEELVRAGRVTVNGEPARIGARVGASDVIRVEGRLVRGAERKRLPRVLLYHKPDGEIVSRDDPAGRASVFDRLPPARGAQWLAVGRLDYNTGGLLLLTTDGELANRMMHPRYGLEREYAVRIRGRVAPADMEKLRHGIRLEDGQARFDSIEEQGGEGANRWYRIAIREGRNRVVRRLFAALGLSVSRLMRLRFGPVTLPPRLRRGQYVELPPREVQSLLASLESPPNPNPDPVPRVASGATARVRGQARNHPRPFRAR
ncbi:MAG: pseudouridine synthase [Burkholderiales bacterium]